MPPPIKKINLVRQTFQVLINIVTSKLSIIIAFIIGIIISQIWTRNSLCRPQNLVKDNSFFVIVLILSSPTNVERRNAIRETWLNFRPRIINNSFYSSEVIFLPQVKEAGVEADSVWTQKLMLDKYKEWMGMPVNNVKVGDYKVKRYFAIGMKNLPDSVRAAVMEEQRVFADLLLLPDLVDSYENLTSKLIGSLAFINQTEDFSYLLKCDDDTYVKLDILSQDLLDYDTRLRQKGTNIELYWGYFNGRAQIKTGGKWKEQNFNLCEHYLPYALGGGYIISKNLVSYISENKDRLKTYLSEDITMGTWLTPFKNIHKRHDVRFDTGYVPRPCQPYHIVLHKKSPDQMRKLYKGASSCTVADVNGVSTYRKLSEYFYDWQQAPNKCCDNTLN